MIELITEIDELIRKVVRNGGEPISIKIKNKKTYYELLNEPKIKKVLSLDEHANPFLFGLRLHIDKNINADIVIGVNFVGVEK